MAEQQKPLVGVALIVMKLAEKEVLLGKRKGAHGAGTWNFPGGKLEYETIKERAIIELAEETGLSDKNVRLIDEQTWRVTEDFFREGLHYITHYLRGEHVSGIPRVIEPDKCGEWKWYQWQNLPRDNLFTPVRNLIKLDYNPFTDLR